MEFKKITLLFALLFFIPIAAQIDESVANQFPEILVTEEWSGTEWVEVTTLTTSFNSECLPEESFISSQGSTYSRVVYAYNSENQTIEVDTQAYDGIGGWISISRVQSTYVGDNLTEEVTESYNGFNLVLSSRSQYSYNGSNQLTEELYQERNLANTGWENSNRSVYTYNGSGTVDEETYQEWDSNTTTWGNSERVTYIYSGSDVTEFTEDLWDGAAWEPDLKYNIIYNTEGQMIELNSSYWDGSSYVLDGRTLFDYDSNGFIEEITEQDYNGSSWDNDYRTSYTYPACSSLSVSESEVFNFGFYPNPADRNLKISNSESIVGQLSYAIYDMSGRAVKSGQLDNDKSISLAQMVNGVYLLKLNDNKRSVTKQFIVKH
ncbi:T9SS type A sorting domain-containing protein [Winogradskyella sp. PC D3.3]